MIYASHITTKCCGLKLKTPLYIPLCGIWARRNKSAGNAIRFLVFKYKKAPKKEPFYRKNIIGFNQVFD